MAPAQEEVGQRKALRTGPATPTGRVSSATAVVRGSEGAEEKEEGEWVANGDDEMFLGKSIEWVRDAVREGLRSEILERCDGLGIREAIGDAGGHVDGSRQLHRQL